MPRKKTQKKTPAKRCLFCNREFQDGEPFEMVKAEDRPTQFFHYKCFVSWRDTIRRGGVVVYGY